LQGQLLAFQQIVIDLKDEMRQLKETNTNSNVKHENFSSKHITINDKTNVNEITSKNSKKRREDLEDKLDEFIGEDEAGASASVLGGLPLGSAWTKPLETPKFSNKNSNPFANPLTGNAGEKWRVHSDKRTNAKKALLSTKTQNFNTYNATRNTQKPQNYKYKSNKNLVIGNKSGVGLRSVSVSRWFYTGRWDLSTELSDVREHIKSFLKTDIQILELDTTKHNKFKSFKFRCETKQQDAVLRSDNWPDGIAVGRYYNGPSKKENITTMVSGADSTKVGPIRVNNTEVTPESTDGSNEGMEQ
jgi:hypothetical protein